MGEDNVLAQLIRKVLYVGFFALLLNNFKGLADIVFQSFAGLGLKASGASLTAADLMRPGFVASTGFTASRPLLEKAGELIGITSFFTNFVTIVVLMLAWLIVLLAFFVLSVQLFITIIEFKLTVLAGFVLVPFALVRPDRVSGRTSVGQCHHCRHQAHGAGDRRGHRRDAVRHPHSPDRRHHADAGRLDHPGRDRRVRVWPCLCPALPPASFPARRSSAPARPSPPRRRSAARRLPAACSRPVRARLAGRAAGGTIKAAASLTGRVGAAYETGGPRGSRARPRPRRPRA